MAEARVDEERRREDDARREYHRIQDETSRQRATLEDLKRKVAEAQEKLRDLTEWAQSFEDIKRLYERVYNGLIAYLQHTAKNRDYSINDRQAINIVMPVLNKLKESFCDTAARATRKVWEKLFNKTVTDTPQTTVHQTETTRPAQSSGGTRPGVVPREAYEPGEYKDWWDDMTQTELSDMMFVR
jgi:chromosome segregation ATPase